MSTLALSAALLASPAALPTCSWDRPGHRPFVGDVVAAVDRYQDIPAPVRAVLKERMARRAYDEVVAIKRDAIVGRARYEPGIREMHFDRGQVCGEVTRARWTDAMTERGLVYCESGHCILVPTVCRNVSRITRTAEEPTRPTAEGPAGPAGPGGDLNLPPTAAGVPDQPPGPSFEQASGGGGTPVDAPGPGGPGIVVGNGPGPGTPSVPAGQPPSPIPEGSPPVPGLPFYPSLPPSRSIEPQLPPVTPAVPEPQTWAMLLGGLAFLAWRARRARTAADAVSRG